MFSAVYSSCSSSNPSPSSSSSLYFASKRSEMYFKKINPRTTDLYSDASMFPRRTQAASQICFSKPILLVLPAIVFSPLHFVSVKSLWLYSKSTQNERGNNNSGTSIRYDFHNILNPTIQRRTDLQKYLRCDMAIPPHLGHGRWTYARLFTQVFFLHVLIDE